LRIISDYRATVQLCFVGCVVAWSKSSRRLERRATHKALAGWFAPIAGENPDDNPTALHYKVTPEAE